MLVILDHAGFALFSGGFVGVDVFFAISGFLITGIVHRSITKGEFSMGSFLGRRMKRLLPALLLMVGVTAVAFTFVMLPSDLINLYRSIIWVVLYLGNFFFWRVYGVYFSANAQEAPLLHTWSLAVEEQYYLIWPIALLLIMRVFSGRATVYAVGALFLLATYASQLGTEMTFGAAYYLLPTRFFELLLGSCLALAWGRLPQLNSLAMQMLSVTGLAMIGISSVAFDENTAFPGYNALLPVVGTTLIIYARDGVVNRVLSLRPFVFTGRISYSMYLWHWPLVTLLYYVAVELSLVLKLAVVALTYVASILSWRYVEQPLRHSDLQGFRQISMRLFVVPGGALIVLAFVGIGLGGFQDRFPPDVLRMEAALTSHPEDYRHGCHAAFRDSKTLPDENCVFGASGESRINLLMLGDSHANHFVPFIEVLAEQAEIIGQDYTMDACMPVVDLAWGDNSYREQRCRERNRIAFGYVDSGDFDYVVLASEWPLIPAEKSSEKNGRTRMFEERLKETLHRIAASGAVPVIIEEMPGLGQTEPKCPIRKRLYDADLECRVDNRPNTYFSGLLEELAVTFPELIVLRPRDLVCRDLTCETELEGIPLFRDAAHLNLEGSRLLGRLYLEVAENPFANSDKN